MRDGTERIARIQRTLQDTALDALVCALPANVVLLSGYWPVVGTAIAIATRAGHIAILAPADERELAAQGWADSVQTFQPGSLTHLTSVTAAARAPLAALLASLELSQARIGYEEGESYEAVTYAAMHLYGSALTDLLRTTLPDATLVSGAATLTPLRSALVPAETDRVRAACGIAAAAFRSGARAIRPGQTEAEVAAGFAAPLSVERPARPDVTRAGGFVYCMSGPRSAQAGGAYARSGARTLAAGDLVLVHCNSYVDGYWTDITRTYCLGMPDARQHAMYTAIAAARAAALATLAPGVRAADVDAAARDALTQRGFGADFTHGVGHNVGFSAISMHYPPRLHPASPDLLAPGMTFNIEPAIYLKGYGGMRHCDVVSLGEHGPEVLTPFQGELDELIIRL
jgi:Xaa-Pro aminopeptidase